MRLNPKTVEPKGADVTPLRADRPPVEKRAPRDESRTYTRHEVAVRVWRAGASFALAGFLAGVVTMFVVVSSFSAAEARRTAATFSQGVAIGQAVGER